VNSWIRNSGFFKFLWGLMGLYLLNISVDSPDHYSDSIPEDLSINDQESIIEIVIEQILGYEDAIEEYDDNDTQDHNKKTDFKIEIFTPYIFESVVTQALADATKQKFPDYNTYLKTGFQKLDFPPPKI
jgi:hypothetical protein